jgi:hypothetical protein
VVWVAGQQGRDAMLWEVRVGDPSHPIVVASQQRLPKPEAVAGEAVAIASAHDVNAKGVVVGELRTAPGPAGVKQRAFRRWPGLGMRDLNGLVDATELDGAVLTEAFAISDLGVIVGAAERGDGGPAWAYLPDPPAADFAVVVEAPEEVGPGATVPYTITVTSFEPHDTDLQVCAIFLPEASVDAAANPGWHLVGEEPFRSWCRVLAVPAEQSAAVVLVLEEPASASFVAAGALVFVDAPQIHFALPPVQVSE